MGGLIARRAAGMFAVSVENQHKNEKFRAKLTTKARRQPVKTPVSHIYKHTYIYHLTLLSSAKRETRNRT